MTTAPILRWIGITIAAGTLLAVLGPFGSYLNGGPFKRASYWIAAMLLGLLLYGNAFRTALALAHRGSQLYWPSLICATLLASIAQTLATRTGAFWLWPELAQLDLPWPLWFAQTTTLGLVGMLGMGFILRRPMSAPQDYSAPLPYTPLGTDVLALQMEDHYVRVHRPNGSELILMALGRAMEGVEAEGLRTHRSWWVAHQAVVRVEGTSRSMRLHLSNGMIAPVARSAVIHLKTAGWITDRENDVGFQYPTVPS
jgi:hypothetical protein